LTKRRLKRTRRTQIIVKLADWKKRTSVPASPSSQQAILGPFPNVPYRKGRSWIDFIYIVLSVSHIVDSSPSRSERACASSLSSSSSCFSPSPTVRFYDSTLLQMEICYVFNNLLISIILFQFVSLMSLLRRRFDNDLGSIAVTHGTFGCKGCCV